MAHARCSAAAEPPAAQAHAAAAATSPAPLVMLPHPLSLSAICHDSCLLTNDLLHAPHRVLHHS